MNSINLIGRLTRDPELRSPESGPSVCGMRLAVNDGSERPPLYVDVVTFGKQADACAAHLSKGRQVAVSGRLHYSEWESDDGSKHSKHEVIGRVQFLARPNANGSSPEHADVIAEPADEEIPF